MKKNFGVLDRQKVVVYLNAHKKDILAMKSTREIISTAVLNAFIDKTIVKISDGEFDS